MKEIAVIGDAEFSLGFRLAGIRKVVQDPQNAEEEVKEALANDKIGILIISQQIKEGLSEDTKELVEDAIQPVTVVVSTEDTGDDLKRMVKKSIGIELE